MSQQVHTSRKTHLQALAARRRAEGRDEEDREMDELLRTIRSRRGQGRTVTSRQAA